MKIQRLLVFLFLCHPFLVSAQDNNSSNSIGVYIIGAFAILFLVVLPISSVRSYRRTGYGRYKMMTVISTIPTLLYSFYGSIT